MAQGFEKNLAMKVVRNRASAQLPSRDAVQQSYSRVLSAAVKTGRMPGPLR